MSLRAIHTPLNNQLDLHVQLSLGDPQPSPSAISSPSFCAPATPLKGYVTGPDGVSIYYEVHGLDEGSAYDPKFDTRPRVVMVMGLACSCRAWRWQLQDLLQQQPPGVASPGTAKQQEANKGEKAGQSSRRSPMVVCVLDNRGCGMSTAPLGKDSYSTQILANDVLNVMDHLHWDTAHICGFSLGGMISTKLAVVAPQRVLSLTIISSTAGGWQILPNTWRGMKIAVQMVMARTPEDMVDVTLRLHFTKRTLKEWVEQHRALRKDLLRREYLAPDGGPAQPPHGFQGQMHACWHHSVSDADVRTIRSAKFPVAVIHGRHDLLAAPEHGEALAKRLHAPLIMLEGAHFIVRECAGQINMLLASLVLGRRHFTAVRNNVYLDPDSMLQKAWQEGEAAAAAVGAAAGAVAGV